MGELGFSDVLPDWIAEGIQLQGIHQPSAIAELRARAQDIMHLGDKVEVGQLSYIAMVTAVYERALVSSGNARFCDYILKRSLNRSQKELLSEYPDFETRILPAPFAINRASALLFSLTILSEDSEQRKHSLSIASGLIECALMLDDLADWKEDLLLGEENSVNSLFAKFNDAHLPHLGLLYEERTAILRAARLPIADSLRDQFLAARFKYSMERTFSQ